MIRAAHQVSDSTALVNTTQMNATLPEDMVQTLFFGALTQPRWDRPRDQTLHRYGGPKWPVSVFQPTVSNVSRWAWATPTPQLEKHKAGSYT